MRTASRPVARPLSTLPDELTDLILDHLPVRDLARLSHTSREWQAKATRLLWRRDALYSAYVASASLSHAKSVSSFYNSLLLPRVRNRASGIDQYSTARYGARAAEIGHFLIYYESQSVPLNEPCHTKTYVEAVRRCALKAAFR